MGLNMVELPYMSIPTDSVISDTTHMSAEQFGARMRIWIALWRHGGELPDNDDQLARIAGVSRARWAKIAAAVTGGMIRQGGKIFDETILEGLRQARKRSAAGKVAAEARWRYAKDLKSLWRPDASAYAIAMPDGMRCRSNHNHNYNYNNHHQLQHHPHHQQRLTEKNARIEYNGPVSQNSRPETAEELDDRRRLFDTGLPILQAVSGKPEQFCRRELKRVLKESGQGCRLLADLCEQANAEKPADVFDWLTQKADAVALEVTEGGSEKIGDQPQ
jgi:uncharacterized protein YdaU (DUF1376 family)